MTILVNDIAPRVHYLATHGQTVFQVPFEWIANSDLKVWVNEILCTFDAPPLNAMHYSTTGENTEGGGTITFGAPGRLDGDKVIIVRDLTIDSPVDFPTSGLFPVASLNAAFDEMTAGIQQAEINVQQRSLRQFDNDFVQPLRPIPMGYDRANRLLGFDADGQPTVYDRGPGGDGGNSGHVDHRVSFPIDLTYRGLAGDGITDDSAKFAQLLTLAETSGTRLIINSDPSKRYLLKRVVISNDIEIDLGGGTLTCEYLGATIPTGGLNILKSLGNFAKNTLNFTGVSANNTIINIGNRSYRLVNALTTVNDVKIGATNTDTALNLAAAINNEAGAGTLYEATTWGHTEVRATENGPSVILTAREEGTIGNSIACSEGSSTLNFTTPTLTGGAAPISITIRNGTIDGRQDGAGGGVGAQLGEPMLWFVGGRSILFENLKICRGTAHGHGGAHPRLLEYTNCDVLIDDPARFRMLDCSIVSNGGEAMNVQSWSARTVAQIERCYFSKKRDYNLASVPFTNSGINLFNLHPTTYARGLVFQNFIKSAANFVTAGSFENIFVDDVSDSGGLDFNETSSTGVDGITVRNVYGRDIPGGYLIRASASNFLVENVIAERCLGAVMIEGDTGAMGNTAPWSIDAPRELENILLRNIRAVAGLTDAVQPTDYLIRVRGASSVLPAHVIVEGGPNVPAQRNAEGLLDPTISPITYGIYTLDCDLTLRGGRVAEGRAALIAMTGYANFLAQGVRFNATATGIATHILLLDAATVGNVVFSDCEREGALIAGASDVRFVNGGTMSGRIALDRSPTILDVNDLTKPVLRDGFLRGTINYNPAGMLDGAGVTTTVTVVGAQMGDLAAVAFSQDILQTIMTSWVSAVDTVTVRWQNESTITADIVAGNIYAWVKPRVGT